MGSTELKLPGPELRSCFHGGREPSFRRILAGLFLFSVFILPQATLAQRKSDIGLLGGTAYYLGDLNFSRHFYNPSVAGGALLRYNLNPRNSIRLSGIYGTLRGSDPMLTDDFHTRENFSTSVLDLALCTEFNFRAFKTTKLRKERYTPYISGGIAYSIVLASDVPAEHTTSLAFGGGFKYNLTRKLSAGLEWTFRKAFNDSLDGVRNTGEENNVFFHNNDWYSIVGLFITYKIFNWREDCPAYD
jgi:opacity protein-like surface antigen